MTTSLPRVIAALFALVFILAACASATGAEWTYAPVVAEAGSAEVSEPEEASVTEAEAGEADPAAAPAEAEEAEAEAPAEATEAEAEAEAAEAEPAAAAAVSGEPRVIRLQADAALRFTDPNGEQVRDIPVVPGETVVFEINNTAGFAHNFYIGTDAELMVPAATTEVGIPDWNTGVQTLEWVVPEDITDLKFGCTVPGHYTLMQGTFSVDTAAPAEAPAEATEAEAEPAEAGAETEAAEGGDETTGQAVETDARVIPLEADAALRFTQNGEQIREIPVTPGEKVIFRIDNTAGFAHNFYIGEDSELSVPGGTTDVGIPDWNTGVQHLEWVVPDDITGIRFACTVPGHYTLMQGDFTVSP